MRRSYAILLFIPLAILFLEWVRVPYICEPAGPDNCEKIQGPATHDYPAAHDCPTAHSYTATHDCCKKDEASNRNKTTPSKEKHRTSSCVDCPMCYVVTFQPVTRFEYTPLPGKRIYIVMPPANLAQHPRSHWKPPNTVLIS